MKRLNLFFYFILLSGINLKAQYNLVPNPGFEQGNQFGQEPRCAYYSGNHNDSPWLSRLKARHFTDDIAYWEQALYTPDNLSDNNSSDWEGDNCFSALPCLFTPTSKRFVHSGNHEGILVTLKKNGAPYLLKGGQTYTFRIKIYAADDNYVGLRVMFATWGEHWNSTKKANTKFNDAVGVGDDLLKSKYGCGWVSYSKTFTVPDGMGNKLGNLILLNNYGAGSVRLYMDDVELYEGDCSQDLRVENKTYSSIQTAPYEHQNIYAGYDAGDPDDAGNVVVESTADLSYKGVQSVQLLPGFETKPGATFLAYLAPCSRLCFYPTAYAGASTVLCGPNQTYQLGFPNLGPDNSTYVWTADPFSAIGYLSNPNIHNPVFTGPSTGIGVIHYTQIATNSCGEVSRSDVYIHYDTQPSASPAISVSSINMKPLEFDLNFNAHTEMIKIEIFDQTNVNLLATYSLEKGADFTTSPFHWILPNPYDFSFCNNYQVRVTSKNYCYANWSSTTTFAWNPPPSNKSMSIGSIPNVFTPNGDGINDFFCVDVNAAVAYIIQVYDRDGVLVHKEGLTPLNGEPKACMWDGRCTESSCINHGVVSDGTYFYSIWFKPCYGDLVYFQGYVQISANKNPNGIENKDLISSPERTTVFPNPTTGQFTIGTTHTMKAVEIMNTLGRIVYSERISGTSTSVHLENVAPGIYFIRTTFENGSSLMDKINISKE